MLQNIVLLNMLLSGIVFHENELRISFKKAITRLMYFVCTVAELQKLEGNLPNALMYAYDSERQIWTF